MKTFRVDFCGDGGERVDSLDLMLHIGIDTVEEILRSLGHTLDRQCARIANPNHATD